ncbi:hypothetical protein AVEN_108387-1 [Araneus ventricosus]|uniref:Uncharacterized protein n=1 Tax=Araneus ventricosus TaxID=182803 RepID=A0A4Y2CVJ2_ARAVE|nr:hypothetical protein AVEN_108387-1 [Araneus ventricosus]
MFANEGVIWRKNILFAQHFGGLCEAKVKSMKYHLKRVIGSQILTQEDFSTVLEEIESVLNSQPLVATSDDPDDFSMITPGHFLVGEQLWGILQSFWKS